MVLEMAVKQYSRFWNTEHSYLNHIVKAGMVFGPPVHAVLVLILVVLVARDFVRQSVHHNVGPVLHRD